MNPVIGQLRVVRTIFIAFVLLFMLFLHDVHPAPRSVDATVQWSIVCCAIASALSGFIVQWMLLRAPSQSVLEAQSSTLRGRWFTGHLIRFATAASVALFAFVLRMMGSYSKHLNLLVIGSLLLLLLWQPGEVPAVTESESAVR
jgi:hypothetical protein